MALSRKICFAFLSILLISCLSREKKTKEKLFQATYDGGVGGCSLVFYKDSTCTWMAGIMSDDKEGTYRIEDSLITLEGIPIETCLKSDKLVITTINPNNKLLHDSILVQVNSNLDIVDSIHIFTVI